MGSLFKHTISAIKNDGGERWKGKRIVSMSEWAKNTNVAEAFQSGNGTLFNLEYALSHIPAPGSGITPMFVGRVKRDVYDQVQQWNKDYNELIEHYYQSGRLPRPKPVIPVV